MIDQTVLEKIDETLAKIDRIEGFAKNSGFYDGLIIPETNNSTSTVKKGEKSDYYILLIFCSIFLFFTTIAIIEFNTSISTQVKDFLFLIGILFGASTVLFLHLKLKNNYISTLVGICALAILYLGTGNMSKDEFKNIIVEKAVK